MQYAHACVHQAIHAKPLDCSTLVNFVTTQLCAFQLSQCASFTQTSQSMRCNQCSQVILPASPQPQTAACSHVQVDGSRLQMLLIGCRLVNCVCTVPDRTGCRVTFSMCHCQPHARTVGLQRTASSKQSFEPVAAWSLSGVLTSIRTQSSATLSCNCQRSNQANMPCQSICPHCVASKQRAAVVHP